MKKTIILSALLVAPTLTFAGGYGNMTLPSTGASMTPSMTMTPMAPMAVELEGEFGSSENPLNAIEARAVTGTENDNFLQRNYRFIPSTFWETQGMSMDNGNGYIELEEYLGETQREQYAEPGADLSREDERQVRARNKALRLRAIMGY